MAAATMAGVVVCRDMSVMGPTIFEDNQCCSTVKSPLKGLASCSRLPVRRSFASEQSHKGAEEHPRGNLSCKAFVRQCFASGGPSVRGKMSTGILVGKDVCPESLRPDLRKSTVSRQNSGVQREARVFAGRNGVTGPKNDSVLGEPPKAEQEGQTQPTVSPAASNVAKDNLMIDAEWEDLEEGEIDAAIDEISAEFGYDFSADLPEAETEEITVEQAVASLPVGLMDRSREVREYYEQKDRGLERGLERGEAASERLSVEELLAREEAARAEEEREAALRQEREEEGAVYSAGESDDENEGHETATETESQTPDVQNTSQSVTKETNGAAERTRLESTSDAAQDIRTVPIDEFGEPVWDYQPESKADPEEEKYQMKADALPPDLLEHLKKARDRKAERDTEVIEVGYDQVYDQQVPKWRREIEEKEKAQKERERTQLEDYVFRKKLFSYVEKKGVKVTETRHTYDDEGREIARDGKPLNDLNVAEAKLASEAAEREAPQAELPDWEAPYEPFPDDEYSDSEDEGEGDQESDSASDMVAETAKASERRDQSAEAIGEMREKLEERFGRMQVDVRSEEGELDRGDSEHGFEALAGEPGSRGVRLRKEDSAESLSGKHSDAEKLGERDATKNDGAAQGTDTDAEETGSREEKSPWEKSTLPTTHLKDHEELGIDWGQEEYEDCFSDDEEQQNSDAESTDERKARLRAMHKDLDRRMSERADGKGRGAVSDRREDTDGTEDADREDDMPSQAELRELAKELEAALPKVTYKQMESLRPVLRDFGLEQEPLSELLLKPGFGNFMSDQLSKRSGTLARRQIKFPVAAVGKMLKDKGLTGRNIGEILESGEWRQTQTVDLWRELERGYEAQNNEATQSGKGPASEPSTQPDPSSWLESSKESGLDIQLDSAEESTESNAESEELKRQLGLSEASLQDLFKDGLLKKEEVMDNLKSQLSQLDNEEFWGAEAEPIPDDDVKKAVVDTAKLPPTDGPIRFEGDQMSREELWELAESDPFEQPLVPQVSSAEWEELTSDPSPLVVEIFATWAGPCKTMAVEVAKLARTMGERIRVVKLNAENEKSLAAALRVANVPTIVFIRGQQVVMKLDSVVDLPGSDLVDIAEHIFFQGPFPECMKRAVDRQAQR